MLAVTSFTLSYAAPWTQSASIRSASELRRSNDSFVPPVYTLDLDAPAATRWAHIAKDYTQYMPAVTEYFESVVPAWAVPLIEAIAGSVTSYFTDYGDEMEGLATALGVKKGEIVLLNLVMQIESLGLNCSNWNETAPTVPDDPGCMLIDPKQTWCYCHDAHRAGALRGDARDEFVEVIRRPVDAADGPHPGLCTSVVAQNSSNVINHGRNLDWNLPVALRNLVVDLDVMRGGERVYRGTGAVGFVGLINGMRMGTDGKSVWAVSVDARGKGGTLFDNLLQALLHHSMTPAQHLRKVLEHEATYDGAVASLQTTPQIDENYFIVSGAAAAQGVVIARGRNKADDVWPLNTSETDGWFRLQTNYDHWNPPPVADDRRTPGVAMMKALGAGGVNVSSTWDVIKAFPVFNPHTDYSVVMVPATGYYSGIVWMG